MLNVVVLTDWSDPDSSTTFEESFPASIRVSGWLLPRFCQRDRGLDDINATIKTASISLIAER